MMRLKDNRHEITKLDAQFPLMIILKEEDLFLGRRALRNLISNPDTEIRHPIDNLASTYIRTENQT